MLPGGDRSSTTKKQQINEPSSFHNERVHIPKKISDNKHTNSLKCVLGNNFSQMTSSLTCWSNVREPQRPGQCGKVIGYLGKGQNWLLVI